MARIASRLNAALGAIGGKSLTEMMHIGSYENYEEFQIGTLLIFIMTNNALGKNNSVNEAVKQLEKLIDLQPDVLKKAELESRQLIPDLWSSHDAKNTKVSPLCVWGIWFYADRSEAHYEVNCNFDYPQGIGFPDFSEESLFIKMQSSGYLSVI